METKGRITPPPPGKIRVWHLFSYADGKDKTALFFGSLFAIGQGCGLPFFAVFFGDAVSASSDPSKTAWETMSSVLMWFGILAVWLIVMGTVWTACFTWAAERQCARLRVDYLTSVLEKDIAWFDVSDPASLPVKMVSEVQSIQTAIGQKFGMIVVGSSQFVAGLVIAFFESWELALVISSGLPMFLLIGPWMASAVSTHQAETHAQYGKAGAVAQEVLAGIRTVAAFGGEEVEASRYYGHLAPAKRGGIRAGFNLGAAFGSLIAIFGFLYALGFWYCAYHFVGTKINTETNEPYTGGEAIMVFFSVLIGIMAFNDMGPPFSLLAAAMTAYRKIAEMKRAEPEIEVGRGKGDSLPHNVSNVESIELMNVKFAYPSRLDKPVLQGINLTIKQGQKVAFVGESGSGKSTVIQLMERFYDPLEGDVLINGTPLRSLPVYAWRKVIGYVGQEPVLFATTVKENIKGGDSNITDDQVAEAAKQAQAADFLNSLPKKFDTFVGLGGGQMSGGQKQRIAIARALVKQPQILLLDEATSALDNQSEKEVQATIDALQTDGLGKLTTISVAHRLSTIKSSDVIFFLKNGVVEERGTHEQLMMKMGSYFALVQTQTQTGGTEDAAPTMVVEFTADQQTEEFQKQTTPASETRRDSSKELIPKSDADLEKERLKALGKYKPPMKKLFMMSKPEWVLMPMAFVGALLSGANMPCMGYLFVEAMSSLSKYDIVDIDGDGVEEAVLDTDGMQSDIDQLRWYFVGLSFIAILGEATKSGFFAWIQEALTLRIRDKSFRALLRQHVGYFDDPENGPSRLTALLSRQASQVSTITGISLGNALGTLCSVVVGLTMGFVGSWQLALIVLGAVPVVGVAIGVVVSMNMEGVGGNENKAYAHASEVSAEAVLNIRTVRALRAEEQSIGILQGVVNEVAQAEAKKAPKKGFAFGFGNGAMFIIYIVGFGAGALLIDAGELDFTGMLRAIMCIMFGLFGAGFAMAFAPDAAKGKLAAHDVFKLLDRESLVDAINPTGSVRELGNGKISFQDVQFFYPHRAELQVLKGLTFDVAKGQSVALCGPSGSGKSTVIQLLQRFYDPSNDKGQVNIGGSDLRSIDIKWWRQQVGYVGQEPVLFDMSVEENIRYGKQEATKSEIVEAAKKANMDFVLEGKVQWSDSVGDRGGKLSGGQKQRVAIARALVRDPAVLLLDEATSALDSVSEKVVQQALDVAKKGRTTFVIAHRLSTIRDSDIIFVLVQGRLVEQGNHTILMEKRGVYYNLANASG